jgi:hypothetical protein
MVRSGCRKVNDAFVVGGKAANSALTQAANTVTAYLLQQIKLLAHRDRHSRRLYGKDASTGEIREKSTIFSGTSMIGKSQGEPPFPVDFYLSWTSPKRFKPKGGARLTDDERSNPRFAIAE